jgi:NTE family protein
MKRKPGDNPRPRIGIALGSGSARGWSHIGVLRALAEMGVEPDIVAGCSIGAFVGAAYVNGNLDAIEDWTRALDWKDILGFMDVTLIGGGLVQGDRLLQSAREFIDSTRFEKLDKPFGTVATNMETGREVWFREGPLLEGVRASLALPGLFTPIRVNGEWLVDGGLTNPVPVSLCRAMGADIVIAVNLNGDIVGKHRSRKKLKRPPKPKEAVNVEFNFMQRLSEQIRNGLSERRDEWLSSILGDSEDRPGMFEVMASSINIMQDRITRSRMAGDPPEILITPRLSHLALMEFDRAADAIAEGRAAVERMKPVIAHWLDED